MLRYEILRLAESTNELLNKIMQQTSHISHADVSMTDTEFYRAIYDHLGVMTNFLIDILGYVQQHELQEYEGLRVLTTKPRKIIHNEDASQSQPESVFTDEALQFDKTSGLIQNFHKDAS